MRSIIFAVLLSACSPAMMTVDAPTPDVTTDAGVVVDAADSGEDTTDAAPVDAGVDAPADAGTDAAPVTDAGSDAGTDTGSDAGSDAGMTPDAPDAPSVPRTWVALTSDRCALDDTGAFWCWGYGDAAPTELGGGFVQAQGRCARTAAGSVSCMDGSSLRVVGVFSGDVVAGSTVGGGCASTGTRVACWEESPAGVVNTCVIHDDTYQVEFYVHPEQTLPCTEDPPVAIPGTRSHFGAAEDRVGPTGCWLELTSSTHPTYLPRCVDRGELPPGARAITNSHATGTNPTIAYHTHCVVMAGELLCTTAGVNAVTSLGSHPLYAIMYSPEASAQTALGQPAEICMVDGGDIACVALGGSGTSPITHDLYTVGGF